jgi:hypothetical protein
LCGPTDSPGKGERERERARKRQSRRQHNNKELIRLLLVLLRVRLHCTGGGVDQAALGVAEERSDRGRLCEDEEEREREAMDE